MNNKKFILSSSFNVTFLLVLYDILTNKNLAFKETFVYGVKIFTISTFAGVGVILLKESDENIN